MSEERRDYAILISLATLEEAEVMASALRADGIDAFIGNRHHLNVDWGYTLALGGVQVFVPRNRVDDAKAAMRARWKEAAEMPDPEAEPVKRRDRWKVWLVFLVAFLLPVGGLTANNLDDHHERLAFEASLREPDFQFLIERTQLGCGPDDTISIERDGTATCTPSRPYLPEDPFRDLSDRN